MITGKTKVMFIIADPVDHVMGTAVLNEYFSSLGFDIAASPLRIAPRSIPAFIAAAKEMQNVIGFGVTIPHKIDIVRHLDEVTDRARKVGAVNFVRRAEDGRLTGDNLDGTGFIRGLGAADISVKNRRVLQVGAGGAGRAVAFAIAEAGASALLIANRTAQKARELADEVHQAYPECQTGYSDPVPAGFDVVVNTTSLGMHPDDPAPIDLDLLTSGMDVAEIIMRPEMTPLLERARNCGCRISKGKSMLEGQLDMVRDFLGL